MGLAVTSRFENLPLLTSQVGVSTYDVYSWTDQSVSPTHPVVDCSKRCSSIRHTSRCTRPLVMSLEAADTGRYTFKKDSYETTFNFFGVVMKEQGSDTFLMFSPSYL